ncbi:tetratricopeptide repeat protein [Kordia sp. YSTF-M3]|uniref:Tetratricopeptide repeat protein n=1 Tax=Kordia aestuariivivens TaxID=2759037 RepID=A0ABR7Q827_9FLAO|nr:tetratricopeptide repeat protein [Kordia aestuariivivens]MBC8754726.1 tetratricopeptide repeat protein [Kordia aestuariivivens]
MKHRILRISIGIGMLLSLVHCTQQSTSKNNTDTDDSKPKTHQELVTLINENKKTNLPKMLEYSDALILSAKNKKDTLMILEGYLQKGVAMTHLGDREKAIDTLKSQFSILESENYIKTKCRYFLGIGNAYVLHWKNLEALNFYEKAYKIATEKGYKNWKCIAQVNIAKITRNIGDREEALKIYKDAYAQATEFHIKEDNKLRILMGIGGTFLTLNKPDSALHYSNMGLKISTELNNKMLESYFYHDIGIAYTQKKEYQKALKNLYKVLEYTEPIQNDERSAESLFYIGKCYYELQKYELASQQFEKVVVIVNSFDKIEGSRFEPQELLDTYDLLEKCYGKLKKDATLIKLVASNKNDLRKEIKENNNEVKATLYKNQNQALVNTLKQKALETEFQKKIITIILGCLVLTLIILFYYKNTSKNNKKKFDALMQKRAKNLEAKTNVVSKQINIKDAKVDEIVKRLKKLEAQEYYLDISCSLANMAKKAKTNGTYLTKILKEHEEKTFYEYINELRINYTIQRLQTDKQFRKYTIKHIAMEVGYKSPESFTKHFKQATEINPSYYIKEIEKLHNTNE